MNRLLPIILVLIFNSLVSFAQVANNMCEGALPFCTGTSYSFPAGTGTPSAQTGPFYSCLATTPNPAWYYMKIDLPGMIQITMHSEPSHDIDFCLWGPFDSQNACGMLTSNKVVDCSYSLASSEVVDIANAIAGKYYILIITNYSNQPCNIIFSQTGGSGTTDCTILPPAAANNGPLCVGESLQLGAANMNNAVYHWTGPDGWTSNIQNPVRPNVQLSMAGIYSMFVTVNGQPSADTNHTTVAIFNKPTAVLSGGGSICEGDSSKLTVTCQNNPPWTVIITANGQNPVTKQSLFSPFSFYVHPTVTTTYAITSVSNSICSSLGSGTAAVTVNAKPLPDFTVGNNCSGSPTLFTDGSNIPGGFATAWHWDFGTSGDTSNIQNPTYIYPNGGTYNVLLRVTSNNGCIGVKSKPVIIHPTPLADAGPDKSIAYGTSTVLQGNASGGSGTYSYHWEPASLLTNPTITNPSTVNLTATTDFVFTVSDMGNNCYKSDPTTVTIIGGPLAVQLLANPQAICKGGSTVINAQAGGGSGNYSYIWSSDPPGFSSNLEDITVHPEVTTTYSVLVYDGFNSFTNHIIITVYANPIVNPGSGYTIPNGTSTTLIGSASGGNPPYSYSWTPANLLLTPGQNQTGTVILSETTSFSLEVTDASGCSTIEDVLVTITGGALFIQPDAETPICIGKSTTLHPLSSGGSGNYTYTWSVAGNVFSHESDPVVTPTVTTMYDLEINDGFTQKKAGISVVVNPLPEIHLIPDGAHAISIDTMLACVFDTLTISALNPNSTYFWSNGATTPEITSATTGLAFDLLSYSVQVDNFVTGCSNSADLTIMFLFSECSYGLPESEEPSSVQVFPNPGTGQYTCVIKPAPKNLHTEVLNLQGKRIQSSLYDSQINKDATFTLDISDQPSGIYLLRLFTDDFIRVVKIIKL